MNDYAALGIDIGTSGVRTAMVDRAGRSIEMRAASVDSARRRDPEAWRQAVADTLDELRQVADLSAVRAVAVDGTSGTVLAIDRDGVPLGPATMYNDPADPAAVARVAQTAPAGSAAHGTASPLAKFLLLQETSGIARVLHQADWIAGCLCGQFETTDENNALKSGYDPVARRWPDWLDRLDLRRDLLARVVAPGTVIAPLAVQVAARFGLSVATLVVAGTTDGCAAFLATGATGTGDGVTSLGTTLTIKQLCDAPIFAAEYGIYSHRLGDRWLAGGASNSGGAALLQHFPAARLAALSEAIDAARESPLDYYPLPAPGERFPISDPALAPRIEPRPGSDAAFLHGLLAGIARIERLGYQRLAELGGPPLRSVRSVGGGARNPTWTALRARTLGVDMLRARSEEAAAGVASLALAGLRSAV